MFPLVKEAVASVMPVEKIRYVAFSHVEADECGSLNEWLAVAPQAEPVCSVVAAMVSVQDIADRPPRALADGEVLSLGSHSLQWHDTPHHLTAGIVTFFQSKLQRRYCVVTFSRREVSVIPHSQSQTFLDLAKRFVRQWTISPTQKIRQC